MQYVGRYKIVFLVCCLLRPYITVFIADSKIWRQQAGKNNGATEFPHFAAFFLVLRCFSVGVIPVRYQTKHKTIGQWKGMQINERFDPTQ